MWSCPRNVDCDKILAKDSNGTIGQRPMGMGGPAYGRGVPSITDCCRRTQDIQKTVLSKLMELYRSPIGDGSRGQNWTSSEDVEHDFFEPRIFQ